MPPALFFLFRIEQNSMAMWDHFWFCTKFKVFFSSSVKRVIGLDGDSIECMDYFGQHGHFHNIDSS